MYNLDFKLINNIAGISQAYRRHNAGISQAYIKNV